MTGDTVAHPTPGSGPGRSACLVWIDAREAVIVRWRHDRAQIERLSSDVPARHRATGHVRHDPTMRHGGGGGRPQDAEEPRRLEHLARFVEDVAARLPPDDDLVVLGPGTVREHLERHVRESDEHRRRRRDIGGEPSQRLTERQLVARLRNVIGEAPRRRSATVTEGETDGG